MCGAASVDKRQPKVFSIPSNSDPGRRLAPLDHDCVEDIGLADEARDTYVSGLLIERARRADLEDLPLAHHHDGVRQAHRLGLVVGDVDGCDANGAVDVLELRPHLLA